MGDDRKLLFVLNGKAGTRQQALEAYEKRLPRLAHRCGFSYQICRFQENPTQIIAEHLNRYRPDVAVAVGGDGTCNLLASLLAHTSVALGIVPFGSANGLARELKIPSDLEAATRLLATASARTIDLVRLNDEHLSVHLADAGFNARMVHRFEQQQQRGLSGYFRQLVYELRHARAQNFRIEIDGWSLKRRAHMVALANARRYGTGAVLNPEGRLDDGQFEVVIIKPYPVWAVFTLGYAFFRGSLKSSPYVEIYSCRAAKVRRRKRFALQTDGESLGMHRRVTARIDARCLRVIAPAPNR